jgi:tRNA-2-methylthio-N6-dimethylallyladenosine synthase
LALKYLIETFGCQMNVHDSERLAGLLESHGYAPASTDREADVIVVNTCSVRERAEEKLYSRLGEIREMAVELARTPTVAVTGCVAQQEGADLLHHGRGIDVVAGTQSLKQLPSLIDEARARRRPQIDVNPHDDISFPLGLVKHEDPVRARVTIIEGCNEFCAFCVVPYTRGHERMRPAADILAEIAEASRTGHPEVQLLGQIVNHYSAPDDSSCDFAELLRRASEIPGVERIRFASPHPRHVTDRLIQAIRDLPRVCKHLHLPVQSGSDRILRQMRRRYTRDEYLALVDRLRVEVTGITISTDMIVGFPGETEDDFEATLDLVRRAGFISMFSFKYSPRPNTLARKRMADSVTEAEKTRRIQDLQALQRDIQSALLARLVGTDVAVLVDGASKRRASELVGRTSGNVVVNFAAPADWLGRTVNVRVTEAGPNSVRGAAQDAVLVGGRA